MAGYSQTPLLKKLGLTDQMKVLLIDPPTDYYQLIEMNLNNQLVKGKQQPDFVHLFVTSRKALEKQINILLKKIKPTTIIWVSWYKKSAGMPTDVTEDVIREVALKTILVDVKVCAVSEVWSGLKLVVRRENRDF